MLMVIVMKYKSKVNEIDEVCQTFCIWCWKADTVPVDNLIIYIFEWFEAIPDDVVDRCVCCISVIVSQMHALSFKLW